MSNRQDVQQLVNESNNSQWKQYMDILDKSSTKYSSVTQLTASDSEPVSDTAVQYDSRYATVCPYDAWEHSGLLIHNVMSQHPLSCFSTLGAATSAAHTQPLFIMSAKVMFTVPSCSITDRGPGCAYLWRCMPLSSDGVLKDMSLASRILEDNFYSLWPWPWPRGLCPWPWPRG